MSLLKSIEIECTLLDQKINGRIRAAVAANVAGFVGKPILDCVADLRATAYRAVGNVRRHLSYSISVRYDEESQIVKLVVNVPAKSEKPVEQQSWYTRLKEKLKEKQLQEDRDKRPKNKLFAADLAAVEDEYDFSDLEPKEKKKKQRKSSVEKEREAIQKATKQRQDWRKD